MGQQSEIERGRKKFSERGKRERTLYIPLYLRVRGRDWREVSEVMQQADPCRKYINVMFNMY